MKNAALRCKNDSEPDLQSNLNCSEMKPKGSASTKLSVTRQRRISMECHPDLLMEEMFADTNFTATLKEMESHNNDGDDLYDFLLSLNATSRQL